MIVHLVLFRPRAGLTEESRAALVAAAERARRDIPSINRFLVGQRVLRDTGYAGKMEEFPLAAIIEFADADALQAYLRHPAHADLARLFWMTSERALAYDFEVHDGFSWLPHP